MTPGRFDHTTAREYIGNAEAAREYIGNAEAARVEAQARQAAEDGAGPAIPPLPGTAYAARLYSSMREIVYMRQYESRMARLRRTR